MVKIVHVLVMLGTQDNWANARDVKILEKGIFKKAINTAKAGEAIVIQEDVVLAELKAMYDEREGRSRSSKPTNPGLSDFLRAQIADEPAPPRLSTTTATKPLETAQEKTKAPELIEEISVKPEK